MHPILRAVLIPVLLAVSTASAHATVVTVFGSPADGLQNFNNVIAAGGGSASHDKLENLSSGTVITRPDYTITRNNGEVLWTYNYGNIPGQVIDISPNPSSSGDFVDSGVTLTFNSAINSIGFDVGDWGTCCTPSALYISFDDGAPILVGISQVYGDVFFDDRAEVFVGAFDDSSSFTKVQFWGDGLGEVLYFGGTVHYALLDQGSLPPVTDVPEPASLALFGLGAMGFMSVRRRPRKAA